MRPHSSPFFFFLSCVFESFNVPLSSALSSGVSIGVSAAAPAAPAAPAAASSSLNKGFTVTLLRRWLDDAMADWRMFFKPGGGVLFDFNPGGGGGSSMETCL